MPTLEDPKHEDFAQRIADGEGVLSAFAAAGFAPNSGNASRLKARDSIRARVRELIEEAAEDARVSRVQHIRSLQRLRDEAAAIGKYGPAIQAEIAIGKASGLQVEKVEVSDMPVVVLPGEAESVEAWERENGQA